MEIIAGTYEELTLGFYLNKRNDGYELKQSFTDHSHVGSIRAAAVSAKGVLATGSSDETIKLFHLQKRTELGVLMHHTDLITTLEFFRGSHMFSGSADGKVCVWKTNRWECIKTLKGHKGAVHSIAVHPSGKLAMSVGVDMTLRLWNLITGKSAFVSNIKKAADVVKWSPDGSKYLVVCRNEVDVYNVETAKIIDTIAYEATVHCLTFLKTGELVAGLEDGKIAIHNLDDKQKVGEFTAHTLRVKGVATVHCEAEDEDFLVTVSSDGFVKVWDMTLEKESVNVSLVVEKDTKFRLICTATYSPKSDSALSDHGNQVKQEFKEEVKDEVSSEEENLSDNGNIVKREVKEEVSSEEDAKDSSKAGTLKKRKQKKRNEGSSTAKKKPRIEEINTTQSKKKATAKHQTLPEITTKTSTDRIGKKLKKKKKT